MKYLVLGSAGQIGKPLCNFLRKWVLMKIISAVTKQYDEEGEYSREPASGHNIEKSA